MDFTKLEDDGDSVDVDEQEMSDDDVDEEDSDDNDDEATTVAEINRLQDELSHNPYDYDKHIALIGKLKSIGELDFLREAREKMNKIYPLTPELWLEWINDETSIASTKDQRLNVLTLYDRAVSDYLQTKLWIEYAQFSIGLMDLLKLEDIREILERSVMHAGLNVLDGSLVWGVYRDFECTILATFGQIDESNSDQIKKQISKICQLFRRQFSIPLYNMQESYQEFEKWLDEINSCYQINLREDKEVSNIKTEFDKNLKLFESIKRFEEGILSSEAPHYEQYLKYLDFEIKSENLARTQCLFERAITHNCLQGELWLKYLDFCDRKIVVENLLKPIYERSIRNCPWVADIWIHYMQAMERLDEKNNDWEILSNKIQSIFQQALNNTFQYLDDYKSLWSYYLQFNRRKVSNTNGWQSEDQVSIVRETFDKALNYLINSSSVDYCYDLYKFYAKVEVKYCKNLINARKIWKSLCESSVLKKTAQFWLNYANFELLYGEESEYKKVLLKGLNNCQDNPSLIGDELLRYEREEGDCISQLEISKSKYKNALAKFNLKTENESKSKKPENTLKRKSENAESNESKKKKVEDKPQVHGVTIKTDESKRDQTIFVSNLDFHIDEDEIKEAFAKFGPISDVRLVRNYKGLSKGYCYVEFESINSVHQSLKNDRMMLRNRPVFISEMEKRNKFTYSISKENNKLFVKNIPFEMTKEEILEKVFSDYKDSITDIRLVTFRNGHSKGWAYVEFKDAKTAEKAVLDKNDFEIGDRKLFVAISDPSLAKGSKSVIQSSVDKKRPPPPSSSSLSVSSMIPHSLRVKTQPSKVKLQLDDLSKPETNNGSSTSNGSEMKKFSNDQFRSMFIKK